MRRAFLNVLGVNAHDVLRGIFPFVNKGVHSAFVPRVSCMATARVRVMLMGLLVPVGAVPVVMVLVLHRRVTSAVVCRMHGAALGIPFRVPRLRQLLVLVDRTAVFFRHGVDLARGIAPRA